MAGKLKRRRGGRLKQPLTILGLAYMLGTFSHQLLSTSFDFQAEQLNCAEDGGLNFKPQSSEQTNPVLAVLSSTDLRVLEHDANEANHEN